MVFLNQVRIFLDSPIIRTCSLISYATILAVGCSGRGEKKVAISCAPGQTHGADGKCQASAGNQGGAGGGGGAGGAGAEGLGGEIGTGETEAGGEAEATGEGTAESGEPNPNATPTPEIPIGSQDKPLFPQTQTPPNGYAERWRCW